MELLIIVDAILQEGQSDGGDYDTQSVLNKCKELLELYCSENGKIDPRPISNENDGFSHEASFLYSYIACHFILRGVYFAAEEILLHGWNLFNAIQSTSERKVYKGYLVIWLVIFYQEVLGDTGAATRWALLTHADDALVGHNQRGQGTQRLHYNYGMSAEALNDFNEIISSNTQHQRMVGWSSLNRFADDQLVLFALKYPQHAHIFAVPSLTLEFPPCIPYLTKLWNEVKQPTTVATEKGNALEHFAAYLQLLIPGLAPRSKVIPWTKDMEHDLVVSNLRQSSNFEAELFGRDFLVECKNWEKSVGVSEVGYFLYRMRLTHTTFGIMFAPNGITEGTDEEPAFAQNLCQRAFHEDGTTCIVIEDKDVNRILGTATTFRSLLMEKANELRFGRSHY